MNHLPEWLLDVGQDWNFSGVDNVYNDGHNSSNFAYN